MSAIAVNSSNNYALNVYTVEMMRVSEGVFVLCAQPFAGLYIAWPLDRPHLINLTSICIIDSVFLLYTYSLSVGLMYDSE